MKLSSMILVFVTLTVLQGCASPSPRPSFGETATASSRVLLGSKLCAFGEVQIDSKAQAGFYAEKREYTSNNRGYNYRGRSTRSVEWVEGYKEVRCLPKPAETLIEKKESE